MTQLDLQQRLEQAEHRAREAASAAVLIAEKVAEVKAERDALQQQVNALAAEALYLKDEIVQHSQSTHFCKVCGEDDPCVNDDVCWALTHETPATDAIKRQWMAESLEMFSSKITSKISEKGEPKSHYAYAYIAMNFADQLRQPEEKDQ